MDDNLDIPEAVSHLLDEIPQNNGRLPVHMFEVEGKHHVFDPESGKFFRIDKLTREILSFLPEHALVDVPKLLNGKYKKKAVYRALGEINRLIKSEALLGEPHELGKRPEPVDIKPRIISVTLNVVSSCNLACTYCWNKGGNYGRQETEKKMGIETAKRAIDMMVENSLEDDELMVDYYGGEPLLNFELIRATMDYSKEIEKNSKKTFTYKVTTNGTLLTEEMIEYFSKMGVSLGISVDGTKKVHNANRPFPGGVASWDIVRKNIEMAMKAGNIHVSGRATLMPTNLDMVKALKGLFKLKFYDTEVEFASEPCEAFNSESCWKISPEESETMKREYLKFVKFYLKYTIYRNEAIDVGISNNITRVLHEAHRFSPCGAGSNFICVTEEGDIYPCIGFLGMKDYFLGNVNESIDLEKLKVYRHKMRTVIHDAPDCADCWAKHICAGNCPGNNEQYNSDIFKPHERGCKWLKYQLEIGMWAASEINQKNKSRLEGYRPA